MLHDKISSIRPLRGPRFDPDARWESAPQAADGGLRRGSDRDGVRGRVTAFRGGNRVASARTAQPRPATLRFVRRRIRRGDRRVRIRRAFLVRRAAERRCDRTVEHARARRHCRGGIPTRRIRRKRRQLRRLFAALGFRRPGVVRPQRADHRAPRTNAPPRPERPPSARSASKAPPASSPRSRSRCATSTARNTDSCAQPKCIIRHPIRRARWIGV